MTIISNSSGILSQHPFLEVVNFPEYSPPFLVNVNSTISERSRMSLFVEVYSFHLEVFFNHWVLLANFLNHFTILINVISSLNCSFFTVTVIMKYSSNLVYSSFRVTVYASISAMHFTLFAYFVFLLFAVLFAPFEVTFLHYHHHCFSLFVHSFRFSSCHYMLYYLMDAMITGNGSC
jgi:hypothetical protein